jgi:hypothetical protein
MHHSVLSGGWGLGALAEVSLNGRGNGVLKEPLLGVGVSTAALRPDHRQRADRQPVRYTEAAPLVNCVRTV